jgi:mono/diheme cytochrome c family protein
MSGRVNCPARAAAISMPTMRSHLLAIVGLVAACGTDLPADDTTTDPEPATGESLFADNCARCHGDDGGGTTDAPGIESPVTGYATYVVRHGRNEMGYPTGMDPFGTDALSDQELAMILEWLGTAPHPTTGAELYGRYCVNCHGADGRSGRVKINIVREASGVASRIRFGHGGTNYASRTSYMPAWSATEITDADVQLLRSYVSAL